MTYVHIFCTFDFKGLSIILLCSMSLSYKTHILMLQTRSNASADKLDNLLDDGVINDEHNYKYIFIVINESFI